MGFPTLKTRCLTTWLRPRARERYRSSGSLGEEDDQRDDGQEADDDQRERSDNDEDDRYEREQRLRRGEDPADLLRRVRARVADPREVRRDDHRSESACRER